MPRSPIQFNQLSPEMKKLAMEAKLMGRLMEVYERLEVKVDEVKGLQEQVGSLCKKFEDQLSRVYSLPKGEKGERGPAGARGLEGKPGKDGITPEIDYARVASLAAKLVKQGRDGRDAVVNEDALIARILEEMKDDKKFSWRKIPGLETEISLYRSQLAGRRYGKDTWARGAGTTVSAGANITLTPLSDGTVRIDAAGGTSGSNVTTQYNVTAVQAGSDITIDLTQLTNWATFIGITQFTQNNMPQTEGAGFNFTVSGSTLTGYNMSSGDIFNISYSYS